MLNETLIHNVEKLKMLAETLSHPVLVREVGTLLEICTVKSEAF